MFQCASKVYSNKSTSEVRVLWTRHQIYPKHVKYSGPMSNTHCSDFYSLIFWIWITVEGVCTLPRVAQSYRSTTASLQPCHLGKDFLGVSLKLMADDQNSFRVPELNPCVHELPCLPG